MKHEDFLTDKFRKEIEEIGLVNTGGIDSIAHLTALSVAIKELNYPKQFQCFFNGEQYDKLIEILYEFSVCFKPSASTEIKSTITSVTHYGIDFFFKRNEINNLNIMLPLDLDLVTAENSIIIIESIPFKKLK